MKILVTAGNTVVPIDKVRCITNIFTGRTGASIAVEAHRRGHEVVLLTSHPEVAGALFENKVIAERWHPHTFVTFENLRDLLADLVPSAGVDAIVHCAAVSDYEAAGIFAPAPGTHFRCETSTWESENAQPPCLQSKAAGKVKSDENELWLRLVRTPKLADLIRSKWKFTGIFVKFKLEVDVSDEHLLRVAERARVQSGADLMVANTLEGAHSWAYLGPQQSKYERVSRNDLPRRLLEWIEQARTGAE